MRKGTGFVYLKQRKGPEECMGARPQDSGNWGEHIGCSCCLGLTVPLAMTPSV